MPPGFFSCQLAAGGVDLLPPALPDKHRIIGFPQNFLEFQGARRRRRLIGQEWVAVEGDQVDFGAKAPEQPGQLPGLVQGVIDAVQEHVGKGDAPVMGQGEGPAGGQQLLQADSAG